MPPGATVVLDGLDAILPEWSGTVARDLIIGFEIRNAVGSVILSGNLKDRIVRSKVTGALIFQPIVRDLQVPEGGAARVVAIRSTGYAGVSVQAEYKDYPNNVNPDSVVRSAGSGDELELRFETTPVGASEVSEPVQVYTDAYGYAKTGSVTIVAEESPGGARYSVVLENTAAPVRFDPDTIPIVSFEVDGNDFVLSFLNKANTWYEIQSAPSPEGPWTRKMSKYCRDAPTVVSFTESASTRPRKFFYRVREAPSP